MADHLRKQIREAAVAALTGLPTTGARVHKTRAYPFKAAALPGLLVKTNAETAEVGSMMRPRLLERGLELEIEGYAAGTADVDDVLDAIALEVEQAIAANNTLGNLVSSATLARTELDFDDEAEKPHGLIRLVYLVAYEAREDTPDTPA